MVFQLNNNVILFVFCIAPAQNVLFLVVKELLSKSKLQRGLEIVM